jgi:hypothetical protein
VYNTTNEPITVDGGGSPADSLALNPSLTGQRFEQLAECFQEYRVNRASIHYRPSVSGSGVLQSGAVEASGSEVYAVNELAIGFSADPAFTPAGSFDNLLECGGTCTVSSSPVTLTYTPRNPQWLFTNLPASPSLADLRQCCFGRLNALWKLDPAANVTNAIGRVIMDLDVSFRFPMDNSLPQPGLVASFTTPPLTVDEEKDEVERLTASLSKSGWTTVALPKLTTAVTVSAAKTPPKGGRPA